MTTKKQRYKENIYRYMPWLILAVTFICYLPALHNNFINWDDKENILDNPRIIIFSTDNIFSYFTEPIISVYIPLTLLSWAITYYLAGDTAFWYIFVNILLHLANTYLVFLLIKDFTKNRSSALLVMALFGLSTVHVESVAWITERKDVLYALFFFLALLQWGKYKSEETEMSHLKLWDNRYYIQALGFFALSLLSKGQAVVLPLALILIDYYKGEKIFTEKMWYGKIPFFLLSLITGIIAIYFQGFSGINSETEYNFGLFDKVSFAAYAFIQYIIKTVFPFNLSAAYPLPSPFAAVPAFYKIYLLIAIAVIILIIFLVAKKKKSGFAFGFFLLNIIFMLDHSSVGKLIMADRFVYVASLGIFIAIAYGVESVLKNSVYRKKNIKYIIALYFILLSFQTYQRCGIWKNEKTLFTDALKKNNLNPVAYNGLGCYFDNVNSHDSALFCYNKSIELNPGYMLAYYNRGVCLIRTGDIKNAKQDFDKAILLAPYNAEAYLNRGMIFFDEGKYKEAIKDFNTAVNLKPYWSKAYNNRGIAEIKNGQYNAALADFNEAVRLEPDYDHAWCNRGNLKSVMKDDKGAITDFNHAIRLNPKTGIYYYLLARSMFNLNDTASACGAWQNAVEYGNERQSEYKESLENLKLYCSK